MTHFCADRMTLMLDVSNLSVEYAGGILALEGVGFSIAAGESVALIGANGAGKTSLLLALIGALQAKSGEIRLGETLLGKKTMREIRSRIGLVFQNPDDQLFMTRVFEDVAFGPRNFGCDEEETARRVNAALSGLGIGYLSDRSPLKLSGGEKRLAAIATVLAMEPDLILFDEPTAYLDPRSKRNLVSVIRALPQCKLIATHDLFFAEELCSRTLLLREGELVADAGSELLRDAASLEAAGL